MINDKCAGALDLFAVHNETPDTPLGFVNERVIPAFLQPLLVTLLFLLTPSQAVYERTVKLES